MKRSYDVVIPDMMMLGDVLMSTDVLDNLTDENSLLSGRDDKELEKQNRSSIN